ncbi:HalOD1 output domain-containing protein [Natrinema longum]|uniref:Halobacterial output domain-containing protein n=1 Tax=Natrinema longum TaxID=370324 RepID=A0A8A2U7X2_9EURY|nr:HalOD1 output domain-containing protein [Natrinema longum]MBZ6493909.1 hypothetical protein [Natrinema longum]QSW84754.1 hypothetical protein J0X27_15070 [Natrinema longum]
METDTAADGTQLHTVDHTYRADPDQPLSEAVLAAIASESELDALELADEFGPLYDVVDPTALDSLFQSGPKTERSVGTVTFEYATYRVTVDQDGDVVLEDRA